MNVSVEKEREWIMKNEKNKRERNGFVLTISVLASLSTVCVSLCLKVLLVREKEN